MGRGVRVEMGMNSLNVLMKGRAPCPTPGTQTCPRVLGDRDNKYTEAIFLPLDWDVPDSFVEGVIKPLPKGK
jgi:hypothetical protein